MDLQTRTMRKVATRLIPVLLGLYIIAYLVGLMKDATGSTDGGLVTLAAVLAFGAVLATRVAHDPALEREPRRGGRFSRSRTTAPSAAQPVR